MPRISAFHGIVIWMYHDEPHHVDVHTFMPRCGDHEATDRDRGPGNPRGGACRPEIAGWSNEWAKAHQAELRDNWIRARRHQPLAPIEPLC